MATIAQVRALLGDIPKWDRQTATGDGTTTHFIASTLPIIEDTEVITVNAQARTKPTHYAIEYDLGLITFVTAPADGHLVVAQFSYAELSNATIAGLLALYDNAYAAAAMGARALAGKYASLVDKQVGDLSISYSQKAAAWKSLAASILASAPASTASLIAPYAGGISQSDKDANRGDTNLVRPAFTRSDEPDYPDSWRW